MKPYRSCACRDPVTGRQLPAARCPRLAAKGHGGWYVRFEAPAGADGKRRQPRLGPFGTEKAAKDALVDVLGDVRSGTHTDDRRTTLAVYLRRWLEGQQLARKQRTYESYTEACRLYWIPALGHVQLADLREQHVRDAHKAMRKLNRPAEDGDRSEMLRRLAAARATVPHLPGRRVRLAPLSETRIQRVTAVLRAALNDCKALKVNPAAGIELRVPKRKPILWTAERVTRWRESGGKWRPGPVMVWTPQQTGEFLDAIEEDRLYAALLPGRATAGCAALRWLACRGPRPIWTAASSPSGRPGRVMTPTRTTRSPKPGSGPSRCPRRWPPCCGHGAGGSSRSAWRGAARGRTAAWCSPARTASRYAPATSASISTCSRRKAGLPPIRFHDLRHGAATLSLAAGVDIKIVQEMLGHSTSRLHPRRVHLRRARDRRGSGRGSGRDRAAPPCQQCANIGLIRDGNGIRASRQSR